MAGFYNILRISDMILAVILNGLCFRPDDRTIIGGEILTKKYKCTVCGYVYDPDKGDPDPGFTREYLDEFDKL